MASNWNCDGSGPHTVGEVKKLPLPGAANLILCRACWRRELQYRIARNKELAAENRFPLPEWDYAENYA